MFSEIEAIVQTVQEHLLCISTDQLLVMFKLTFACQLPACSGRITGPGFYTTCSFITLATCMVSLNYDNRALRNFKQVHNINHSRYASYQTTNARVRPLYPDMIKHFRIKLLSSLKENNTMWSILSGNIDTIKLQLVQYLIKHHFTQTLGKSGSIA